MSKMNSASFRGKCELSGELGGFLTKLFFSRKNDREKQAINMEVENQTRTSRDLENSLHQMELKELDLVNKIRDKDRLEEDIKRMEHETGDLSSQSKVDYHSFRLEQV